MKSSFKMVMLPVAAFAFLFLSVVQMSSCQSGSQQPPPQNPATRTPPVAVLYLVDSSGPQPILHTSVTFPSGTTIQGKMSCKDCTDSSGNTGVQKVVFSVTLEKEIPANTDIILHVESR